MRTGLRILTFAVTVLLAGGATAAERLFTAAEIAAAVPPALNLPAGGTATTRAVLDNPYIQLSGHEPAQLELSQLTYDASTQRFTGTAQVKEGGTILAQSPISGRVETTLEVPVLTRALRRGDVIAATDLAWQPIRLTSATAQVLQQADEVIGKTPRTALRAGQLLRAADLANPPSVVRGSQVTLLYNRGRLQLTTKGRALSDAAPGDVVKVASLASSRTLEGIAQRDGTVAISTPLAN